MFIHLSLGEHLGCSHFFFFLVIMSNAMYELFVYKFLCGHIFNSLGIHLGVGLLGHMINLGVTFIFIVAKYA